MSDPQQNAAAAPAPKTSNTKRRVLMHLIVLVVIIAAIAYGLYYFLIARFHESTDDAYVNGNIVQITPQVVGTVISVNANATQTVKMGDPLVVLDPADSKVALDSAEANLAQTVRQVRTLFVNDNQYAAQVALRQSDLSRAQDDLRRRMTIAQTGAVSGEEISHAKDAARRASIAQRGPAGIAVEPFADVEHDYRQPSERARRRREGPRFVHQLRPQHHAGAGDGVCREAFGAGRPARLAG